MTCFWYDSSYKLSTCTFNVGDACHTCECSGDVEVCPYMECGHKIAFEREEDANT